MTAIPLLAPDPVEARTLILGRPTPTNRRLAAAFVVAGFECALGEPASIAPPARGDLVLARLDVLPSLDGIEDGLGFLRHAQRAGATVLNRPRALRSAHDKLATARVLASASIPHPRTAHVREPKPPRRLAPPYVVKPRFGSWGRDVFLCETRASLVGCLVELSRRPWFRTHGALVQELVRPTGRDQRIVVAGGRIVGAVERLARPGEWRTNVALGARRRPVEPSPQAQLTALAATVALGSDLAGVDLVPGPDGECVVLEVNGAVEFTDDYALRGVDPFAAAVGALSGARRARGGTRGRPRGPARARSGSG
jgi:RimK family alpha-L-glutamate ligase